LSGRSPQQLQKHSRLLNPAAFSRVFNEATPSRDKWFTVLCAENERNLARLGLAISKRHCRHATTRNRLKRIVRESFRQHQADLSGLDVVVMSQGAASRAANRCLFASLDGHWRRCARLRGLARKRD
jgi:ribonuclease P protein component